VKKRQQAEAARQKRRDKANQEYRQWWEEVRNEEM
jgi:hypothetical protein